MSWSQLQSIFDGQGLVFWAAVTAVTLGLTLLSISIVFQVRKMVGHSWLRLRRPRRPVRAPQDAATAPLVTVSGDSYHRSGFVPTPTPAVDAASDTDPRLPILLTRLQKAADRLENIRATLQGEDHPGDATAHSPLKSTLTDVDYVYKTGRA